MDTTAVYLQYHVAINDLFENNAHRLWTWFWLLCKTLPWLNCSLLKVPLQHHHCSVVPQMMWHPLFNHWSLLACRARDYAYAAAAGVTSGVNTVFCFFFTLEQSQPLEVFWQITGSSFKGSLSQCTFLFFFKRNKTMHFKGPVTSLTCLSHRIPQKFHKPKRSVVLFTFYYRHFVKKTVCETSLIKASSLVSKLHHNVYTNKEINAWFH